MNDGRVARYPTEWQRKALWSALSALAICFLIFVILAIIWITANAISFLQPILIPVAIAVILAYLLDPLVTRMSANGLGRLKAILLLFVIAAVGLIALGTWLVPVGAAACSCLAARAPPSPTATTSTAAMSQTGGLTVRSVFPDIVFSIFAPARHQNRRTHAAIPFHALLRRTHFVPPFAQLLDFYSAPCYSVFVRLAAAHVSPYGSRFWL